jgi:hypothetical protein
MQAEDHDVPISPREIVEQGLMSQEDWDAVSGDPDLFSRLLRWQVYSRWSCP